MTVDFLARPTERVAIPVPGAVVPGTLALPDGAGPFPAVLIAHELNGFRPSMANAARRLAAAGFAGLAVDLYAPLGGAPRLRETAEIHAWLQQLDDTRQVADLGRCLDWLRARPEIDAGRVALLGYSAGGRYALILAGQRSDLAAVVAFYARPWPQQIAGHMLSAADYAASLRCPVLSLFGGRDSMIPPPMPHEWDALLTQQGVPHQTHIFPDCDHFFANESFGKYYRSEEAEEAWRLVLDFLGQYLGSSVGGR